MANKVALRELQTRLAERLQQARTQERAQSWLAVEAGGHGLLFPLQEAGEIFPLSPLLAVPHTYDWFVGVANLRGGLHGVINLGVFLESGGTARSSAAGTIGKADVWGVSGSGAAKAKLASSDQARERANQRANQHASERTNEPAREQARLVALNPVLECNAALLVDRLAGLRNLSQLTPESPDSKPRPAFAGDRFRDQGGRLWQEVRLSALASDPAFLMIVGS
jgi:twitching motility protein PilI